MERLKRRLWAAQWNRLFTLAILAAMGAALVAGGFTREIDRRLAESRFALLDRPASGSLVLVEIDAASLAALDQWPWPRSVYADAIERLDAAGARLIALDVDFSSRSTLENDERLAAAIERVSGRVVLPTFVQASSGSVTGLIETTPQPQFTDHALLASVNVVPDADGVVRTGSYGYGAAQGQRVSLASLLADVPYGHEGDFRIDFSISPSSLPRLSLIDVIEGRFDPAAVQGRNVLIGATALELGDQLVVPRFKIIAGPVVHALAYESIVQDRALGVSAPIVGWLLAIAVLAAILLTDRRWSWPYIASLNALILALLLGGSAAVEMAAPVQVEVGTALLAQALGVFWSMSRELHKRALEILKHRAAAARQRAVIDATLRDIEEGIIVTDDSGRIEMINPQAVYFLGLAGKDFAGRLINEVAPRFKTYDRRPVDNATGAASAAGAARHQFVAKVEGATHAVEVTVTRSGVSDRTGHHPVIIYSLHDVTARVRYERAEAGAKKAAEEALAAKASLLSTMSHELRTPLNAILGFSEAMKAQIHGPLGAPQYAGYVDLMRQSGQRLLHIVNSVLETARLDSGGGKVQRETLSVRKIVRDAKDQLANKLRDRQLAVELRAPPDIDEAVVDPDMFPWALNELVANAAEYASSGQPIMVELRRDGPLGLLVEVRNNASFIPPEKLATLTEPFTQLEIGDTRAHDGAGLGLHIVNRYAALHGGSLELVSETSGDFLARLRIPKALPRSLCDVAAA